MSRHQSCAGFLMKLLRFLTSNLLKLNKLVLSEPFFILQLTAFHPFIVGIMTELWTDIALLKIFSDECISLFFLMNLQEVPDLTYRLLRHVDRVIAA